MSTLLSSCGGASTGVLLPDDVQIVQRFPQNLVAGPLRLPLSLASGGGLLTADGDTATPDVLTGRIVRIDGGNEEVVVSNLQAPKHAANLAVPYWPFRATINEAGFYRIVLDGSPSDGAAFQVFARREVAVPGVGDTLTPFDTPTFDAFLQQVLASSLAEQIAVAAGIGYALLVIRRSRWAWACGGSRAAQTKVLKNKYL